MQQPQQSLRSEHADPHELYTPVPRAVMGLALGLVIWAIGYIFLAGPDGPASSGDQRAPQLAQVASPSQGASVDGRQLYATKCQACHQAGGQGLPGVFPPLAGASWVGGAPEVPIQILLHGLNGPIEVAGATYNGSMPAFGAQMNDAEIAAVLSFIRAEWGNKGSPIEANAVQSAREKSVQRTTPWANVVDLQQFLASGGAAP